MGGLVNRWRADMVPISILPICEWTKCFRERGVNVHLASPPRLVGEGKDGVHCRRHVRPDFARFTH